MNVAARLRNGPPIVATFSILASPVVVELLGLAGFDAVVLDTEHGPLGPEALNVLVPAARAAAIAPIVRVRTNEPSLIGAALDVGAAAVLVPKVQSADAAAAALAAARFGAGGHRGSNPYVRAAGYGATPEYFARANQETAVMVMVEGADGLGSLDGILATRGLDAIFVGPFDLAQALGVAGQVEHPEVIARIEQIIGAAGAHGVATAIYAPTPSLASRWLALGARLVAVGFDAAMAREGFTAVRSEIAAVISRRTAR